MTIWICGAVRVTIVCRLVKQRFREARVQIQDYVILLLAGVCLGPLSIMKDSNIGVTGYFYTLIALGKPPKSTCRATSPLS